MYVKVDIIFIILNKIQKIEKASIVMMDRWQISLTNMSADDRKGDPMPYNIINNYFSVGVVSH